MTKISNISCVIIAKNSQETIQEALDSLRDFEEVILYLNNSRDSTKEMAQNFSNVKIIEGDFFGFGPTKNKACEYAGNDWILSLDSDEVLCDANVQELKALALNENHLYVLKRDNYYNKKLIKCCGWENDRVVRIFNRKKTSFCENMVHEYILENGMKKNELSVPIKHYPFNNAAQFIDKIQHYSTLFAQNNKNKRNSSPLRAFSSALFAFFKSYFVKKGFLCGYEGLLISVCGANGTFYKYVKLYEENLKSKNKEQQAIVHANFAKGFRGGERQTQLLIEQLSMLGYKQKLLVRKNSELIYRCKEIKNLEIIEVSKPYVFHMRHIKGSSLLHAHETKAAHFAYFTNIIYKIPYIITRRVNKTIKSNYFNKKIYENAKYAVALSNTIKNKILQISDHANTIIIPDAYSNFLINNQTAKSIKSVYGNFFVIGCIGELEYVKGQIYLIEAAKKIYEKYPNIHFVFLGRGKDEEYLKGRAAEFPNITFEGFVDNVGDYMACFDLFVFPSLNEGLGSILLDAMQLEIPIIATNVGGIPDIIDDEVNGLLIPPCDSLAIEEKIIELYNDCEKRNKLISNAKEKIEKYSPLNMALSYSNIYNIARNE